ncbi:thioredoxin family protein [Marinigracilibium pacificum]|uniref:Thioredoxin family protein n=1 Tax=Marinigracilibium pacificum TaxID=2729599 RepID=A0A848J0T0_9BACT|nr:thioredoxin family protein [Marinigracilibium pacificum]NMM46852.1 thioredoxin family protein [Marinigracilibium pacificum]
MKKTFTLFLFILVSNSLFSQIIWERDFKMAQAKALEKDQVMLVDFWAVWCGPCKKMDAQLWNTPEINQYSSKFVPLQVDIDRFKDLARKYNITSIPRVMLMTADGEVIWEKNGYVLPDTYLEIFDQLPESLGGLNKTLLEGAEKQNDPVFLTEVALMFQNIGENEAKGEVKREFINKSSYYFKEVQKNSSDENVSIKAELNQYFNEAIKGNYSKALKKLNKIELSNDHVELNQFKSFAIAYCYKSDGDIDSYAKQRALIENQDYLKRLDQLVKEEI